MASGRYVWTHTLQNRVFVPGDFNLRSILTVVIIAFERFFVVLLPLRLVISKNSPRACYVTLGLSRWLLDLRCSKDRGAGGGGGGGGNMLSKRSGVAKQIQDIQKKAYPTHCHAHLPSLSVKKSRAWSCRCTGLVFVCATVGG